MAAAPREEMALLRWAGVSGVDSAESGVAPLHDALEARAHGGVRGFARGQDPESVVANAVERVVGDLGGANHDPAHYPDPDRFDLDRNPQDVLSFGGGAHYCLGANLARSELVCMIEEALDFLPPGARLLKERMEVQSLGLFDRSMSCPIDFGGAD